jgi:hypothetical protein
VIPITELKGLPPALIVPKVTTKGGRDSEAKARGYRSE